MILGLIIIIIFLVTFNVCRSAEGHWFKFLPERHNVQKLGSVTIACDVIIKPEGAQLALVFHANTTHHYAKVRCLTDFHLIAYIIVNYTILHSYSVSKHIL